MKLMHFSQVPHYFERSGVELLERYAPDGTKFKIIKIGDLYLVWLDQFGVPRACARNILAATLRNFVEAGNEPFRGGQAPPKTNGCVSLVLPVAPLASHSSLTSRRSHRYHSYEHGCACAREKLGVGIVAELMDADAVPDAVGTVRRLSSKSLVFFDLDNGGSIHGDLA